MNQSGVSVPEPIIVGVAAVTLIEGAASDLEDFNEEILTAGHWPSWSPAELPDGLALCVGCWRLDHGVTAWRGSMPSHQAMGGSPMIAAIYTQVTPWKELEQLAEYLK